MNEKQIVSIAAAIIGSHFFKVSECAGVNDDEMIKRAVKLAKGIVDQVYKI